MQVSILKACPECGHAGKLILETRMQAAQLGTFSLAGAGMKVTARDKALLRCLRCNMQRQGYVEDLYMSSDGVTAVSGHFVQGEDR